MGLFAFSPKGRKHQCVLTSLRDDQAPEWGFGSGWILDLGWGACNFALGVPEDGKSIGPRLGATLSSTSEVGGDLIRDLKRLLTLVESYRRTSAGLVST